MCAGHISNQITSIEIKSGSNHMFPNQIFGTQVKPTHVVQSRFKSNRDLDLPITEIYRCEYERRVCLMMMMMKLPILPCGEKLELVLSTAPKT